MTPSRPPATPWTAALDAALEAVAADAVREHWFAYMKGEAVFRGVPMAGIRAAVRAAWRAGLADASPADQREAALAWFDRPATEDKLAAVLLIAEHLAPTLDDSDVALLATPFERGAISDWNVCDWMSVKAIHGWLDRGPGPARAAAIAGWARSSGLWQRRAAVVAFVPSAKRGDANFSGYTDLLLEACARNLRSKERWAHTGPGWLLRELSVAEPARVQAFVEAHPELSPEGRRMATARLRPGPYRRR